MQKTTNSNSGIYILELYSPVSFNLSIKKFKDFELPFGYYYYVGSAQKNLRQRIARHFRHEKKVNWHIDYLTTNKNIILKEAFIIYNAPKNEEEFLASKFSTFFNTEILLKGFGNSDTKSTITHLFLKSKKIPYNHFSARYHSIVRFKPSSSE